jgi:hypothetical protein
MTTDRENKRNIIEIPPEGIETPFGHLYPLQKPGIQILAVIAAFIMSILLGLIVSSIPGQLSDLSKGIIYFTYLLVFILGYSAWVSILGALVFKTIKTPILKMLFRFFIYKEKPSSIEDVLPSREKLTELIVKAQKSARIFFILGWPIGLTKSINPVMYFVVILLISVIFGYVLYYFGRRGYFPFPEE